MSSLSMSTPISPPAITEGGSNDLPPFVSNGFLGVRVVDIPLLPGVVLVNGFTGLHPVVEVEAIAEAPYPIAGDIGIDSVFLTSAPQQATFLDQRYDFATGELFTRFRFKAEGATATVSVLTFCSQKRPTIVLQEITVDVDHECDLVLRSQVDITKVRGRVTRRTLETPGRPEQPMGDGALAWESLGGESKVGVAYVSELAGDRAGRRQVLDWGVEESLATDYTMKASPAGTYRLRQIACLVPTRMHKDPDREAIRLVNQAAAAGFDALREENRAEWNEHWKGRILIDADDDRWQSLADAAFFYLNSAVHPSAPASTSMYGLAQWKDYHYYYGHVMWDIETFCVPPLTLSQPDAARALLEYRVNVIDAARDNAKLHGRRGLQFPWESGPLHGEEASPGSGNASWYEDHNSLDIALAFAQYANATGDRRFLAEDASRVLYGVADWLTSRVSRTDRGFEFAKSMGIAERKEPSDNDAFTLMSAHRLLREAIACAETLGHSVARAWREVADGLVEPRVSASGAMLAHDDYRPDEEKGSTPGPLAGLFPLWHPFKPDVARATLDFYLRLAPGYIGSPMLSPLYGVWAAWAGDRTLSAKLLEEGYAELIGPRFLQTLEQSPSKYPDKPASGPFFANMGGFLQGLVLGLPGIRVGPGDPGEWPARPVVLPAGWRSIEVERAWIRMRPARIVARHGAERSEITVDDKAETGSDAAAA
jgi:trehalose/maltose hydrolase-like predicted phosphorylase